MGWMADIEKVRNGYKINAYEGEEEYSVVFEYKDVEDEVLMEQLTFRDMVYFLKDFFAVHNNKHSNDGNGQYLTIKVDNDEG